MLAIPVTKSNRRSKPNPKPAWGQVPYLRVSRYHHMSFIGIFSSVMRYIFNADEYEKVKALLLSLGGVIVVGLIVYVLAIFNLFGF